MKKSKGERLGWHLSSVDKPILLNFVKAGVKVIEADRRKTYKYLIP